MGVPDLREKCLALCFLDVLGAVDGGPLAPKDLADAAGFALLRADGVAANDNAIVVRKSAGRGEVAAAVAHKLAREAIRWAGSDGAGASPEAVEDALMRYFVDASMVQLKPIS